MAEVKTILSESGDPIGYVCPNCGVETKWPGYVFAHWTETLVHECNCGTKVWVRRGRVSTEDLGVD